MAKRGAGAAAPGGRKTAAKPGAAAPGRREMAVEGDEGRTGVGAACRRARLVVPGAGGGGGRRSWRAAR